MTKQEFLDEQAKIVKQERKLSEKKSELKKYYLKSAAEFKEGDKVIVTDTRGKKHTVFIAESIVEFNGKISYKFKGVKKDGNPTKNHTYIWCYDKIEHFK